MALRRTLRLLISFLVLSKSVFAQGVKNLLFYEPDKTIHTAVAHRPEFPGGKRALENYLATSVRYPAEAKKAGVTGRVVISFVVETDGRRSNVDILKGIGFGCDEEAIRVVKAMPRWRPGKQLGRAVRVRYNLPISLTLE